MLQELSKSDYYKVAKMMTGAKVNLEPEAVIWGYNPGTIYVDDVLEPKSAVIWVEGMKGFYFVGDANNDRFNKFIVDFFDKVLIKKAKKINYKWIEFSGLNTDWEITLAKLFKHKEKYDESKQFVYKHKEIKNFNEPSYELKQDYTVKAIDLQLLNSEISNYDFLESIIITWWGSIDNYLKHGVGYCVMHNNMVISSCVTSYKKPGFMESHIHTLEDYRKQGFATIAVSKFLNYCRDNYFEPYWDCMQTNYGSQALAEKLGYEKQFEYTLFEYII
ncbi:GNAT family N-acetyltransferase [Clostridium sp. 'deep sea']|uniref:GNAT family N-acetyltransferase n=1 Tax=Clostridium sp. 'deep sea' TaxID=2779445 RepID=UPI0018966C97|nr:GNAT family N-acetyltransferase [Clostridium sp. 'deep sea']QOR35302.1 GNAT family N-acetyltransferase [Clostridium sp. 'deep sea']